MRLALVVAAGLAVGSGAAWAQDDPPGRVGRLAELRGQVWWFDVESGAWSEAERNRPLTGGDRISTAPDARAELRVGSTVLRLGGVTEVEVLRLDDEHMDFQLHTGSLALRVREREVADEIRIVTAELPLRPLRSGHYRFDRVDDSSYAGTWRGSQRVDAPEGLVVDTGQRAEFWREGATRTLRHAWGPLPDDEFSQWVASEDLRDQRSAATRHVSPEMTGAEDLDRHGRWDTHPEYGAVWIPHEVRSGWAPYRHGRWVWVRPWGWTWVDEAPWGFAPFHYGRWVHWGGRWGWWPGAYVARPVFAPALVAWVGSSNWGVSVNVGGPAIGWVPLAPREVYVPWYRTTPRYVDRVNRHPPPPGHRPGPDRPDRPPGPQWPQVPQVPQVPTGPVMYGNQGVPGAVTVVPRDVLVQRQPVGRAVITPRGSGAPVQNLVRVEPPSAPAPVPGPRVDGLAPGQPPKAMPRREFRDGGRGDRRADDRELREPRQTGEVRAPNEVTTRPQPGRAPAAAAGSVTTRPPARDHAEPGFERRRERPVPATVPLAESPPGPPRPEQPIRVAPRPAPPSAAPAAPTAPAAPPAAGLRPAAPAAQPVPAVVQPAPAAAPTAPPVMPMPAAPQQRPAPPVATPRADAVAPPVPTEPAPVRGDERKRVPESRRTPHEQLR
ncbi:MAG: hypothetical protein IPQ21_20285 [Betaproteobacteria bacterium]|nr:hypothetical protein [Betaproteobacteria bacterium]